MRYLLIFLLAMRAALAQELLDLPDDSLQVRKIAENTYLVSLKDSVLYAQKANRRRTLVAETLAPFAFYVHIAPKACVSWADDSTAAYKDLKIPFFMRKRTYRLLANYQTHSQYIWIVDNLHPFYGTGGHLSGCTPCLLDRHQRRELDTQSYHKRIAQYLGAYALAYPPIDKEANPIERADD